MTSGYSRLSRADLAILVPELLLIGQLIDRSGMAWCIQAFGRREMLQIAIEEWAASSPIYTRRMQKALNYEGDDVVTIFKGLQFDIGAPPQFMDFRYTVHDRWHGEFHLDHCGALLDVEPLGPITSPECATTSRTRRSTPRRWPRIPKLRSDRSTAPTPTGRPQSALRLDGDHRRFPPDAATIPALDTVAQSRAANGNSTVLIRMRKVRRDYSGQLMADVDFGGFSHSALVRIADEVCLQMHLLNLSFNIAVRERAATDEQAIAICTKQLTGIAGVAAGRIRSALGLSADLHGLSTVLGLHPLLNPSGYVVSDVEDGRLRIHQSPAHLDGAWIALCSPTSPSPLQAIATAVDPRLSVEFVGNQTDWTAEFTLGETAAEESPEVQVAKVSLGATFQFQPRRSLPLTPI